MDALQVVEVLEHLNKAADGVQFISPSSGVDFQENSKVIRSIFFNQTWNEFKEDEPLKARYWTLPSNHHFNITVN